MSWQRMKKPDRPQPLPQYHRSYAELGVIAQHQRLIELRAPDPDAPNNANDWNRLYLTPEAARKLLEWLPDAVGLQDHGHLDLIESG